MSAVSEFEKLAKVANNNGMDLASADHGVNLLNFVGKKRGDVLKQLREGLGGEIEAIVPGAKIETGSYRGVYIDRATEIAAKNMGKGKATKETLKYFGG